jgi:hypothetical protein
MSPVAKFSGVENVVFLILLRFVLIEHNVNRELLSSNFGALGMFIFIHFITLIVIKGAQGLICLRSTDK